MRKEITVYVLAALILCGLIVRTEMDIRVINRENSILTRMTTQHTVCVANPHHGNSCHFEY